MNRPLPVHPEARPAYMTVAEVAQRWRVSISQIRRLIRGGDLASIRVGEAVRIPWRDVQRFEQLEK